MMMKFAYFVPEQWCVLHATCMW